MTYDFSSPSQINNVYKIDKNTGKIYTNSILTGDLSQCKLEIKTLQIFAGKGRRAPYRISVRATDDGTPSMFSDTELYITVGDVSR